MSRQILVCESFEHAELCNQLVMRDLEDTDNAKGSRWSDIFVSPDETKVGILWGSPVANIFGTPEDDPSMEIIDDVNDEWSVMEDPDPETPLAEFP